MNDLQTHTDSAAVAHERAEDTVAILAHVVDLCAERLEEHRGQFERDLAYYRARLDELRKLDPHDFTGLQRLYEHHLQRTCGLLAGTVTARSDA